MKSFLDLQSDLGPALFLNRPDSATEHVLVALPSNSLQFDYRTGTGVVLHMLSCRAIDGRFGVTCIGRTPGHADDLLEGTTSAVGSCL